ARACRRPTPAACSMVTSTSSWRRHWRNAPSVPARPRWRMWSSSLRRLQILHRGLEHLVAALTNTLDGWRHSDLRLNADALELPAIAVPDIMPGKANVQLARQNQVRDVSVCSDGRRADESDVGGGGEGEAGVLSRADGLLVDQHHHFAGVARLA